MSDYGFEIKNSSGQIVADANFPVYTVIQSGTFNTGGIANVSSYTDVYFSKIIDISKMPQFFMELPKDVNGYGPPTICVHSYLVTGTSIIGVRIHSYFFSGTPSGLYSVNYLVAVPVSADDSGSGDYGIIAYDKYGNETFSSGKRLVTIKAISTLNVNELLNHPEIIGTRYVAIAGLGGIKLTIGQYYTYVFYVGVRHNSDTSVVLDWNLASFTSTPLNAEQNIPISVIVAELSL